MKYIKKDLKEGIKLHLINTNKFKTNLFAIYLAVPLEKETATSNALLTAVLKRGTANLQSQELISKKLEEMYGASYDFGVDKNGDMQVIKFYLETINEQFLPEKENLNVKAIDLLLDFVFNPLIENDCFKKEYVDSERNNLKQIIEAKKDNKIRYSLDRCIEEMYKGKPYGNYKYGCIEDLEKIDEKSLYDQYKKVIAEAKIDIFCSGENINVEENIINRLNNINGRKVNVVVDNELDSKEVKNIEEKMQVSQGKLVIGLKIDSNLENHKFISSVYNAILGGGANSKLFQNVREKEGLAYSAGSNFVRTKDSIFIRCGIEIDKYNKALETIKEQLEDIKNGNFTEEDMNSAKKLITSSMKSIAEEQDTEITYYYGQDLSGEYNSLEEYIEKINKVTRNEVVELSKNIKINTIYFLRD